MNWHAMYVRRDPANAAEYCPLIIKKSNISDARHVKTDLKFFVLVIPKEGWVLVAAPILLLV